MNSLILVFSDIMEAILVRSRCKYSFFITFLLVLCLLDASDSSRFSEVKKVIFIDCCNYRS